MASGVRFTAERFLKAIPGSAGIISTIAQRVGCSWHTARKWIDAHPTIKRIYDDEREGILDLAEAKLIGAIKDGDLGAIKYYLGTQGKHRGYVERQEVTGADGEPIKFSEVVVELPDDKNAVEN
jgi:hypothetical protein